MEFTPTSLSLFPPHILIVSHGSASGGTQGDISAGGTQEDATAGGEGLGEDYQKVDYPVLFYHKTTGYYYDPVRV